MRRSILALLLLTLAACRGPAVSPQAPITSAGDPAAPVPFRWSVHESHRADGHRLLLQGGTLHAIPSEVRLLDPSGRVVSGGPAEPLGESGTGLCGDRAGVVSAALPLPASELASFRSDWPKAYRVEVRVGGTWRAADLSFAGCRSIE